jgi:ABC-type lipopolysaccharide export system ATPase subunit
LEEVSEQKGVSLSGGERNRLQLAMTLKEEGNVLLLMSLPMIDIVHVLWKKV